MTDLTTESLRNSLLKVTMSKTELAATRSDKDARHRLAQIDGVGDEAYRVSKIVIPAAHAGPYIDVKKALAAAKDDFNRTTMPIGMTAGGKASPDRVVTTEQIMNENWLGMMMAHAKRVDAAREAFAVALPAMMTAVQNDPAFAAKFDPTEWPTADQIRDSFKFTISGPDPIGDFSYVSITGGMAQALSKRFDAKLAKQVEYGQMRTAKEMLDYMQAMADSLFSLSEFLEKGGKAKRPKVYETLTTNLQGIVEKARTFAIRDTDSGKALLDMAKKIEDALVPPGRTSDDFKDNLPLARATAEKASALIEELSDISFDF